MDQYFAQMAKIADERKSRIKFTLKDVIDLRSVSIFMVVSPFVRYQRGRHHQRMFHARTVTVMLMVSGPACAICPINQR